MENIHIIHTHAHTHIHTYIYIIARIDTEITHTNIHHYKEANNYTKYTNNIHTNAGNIEYKG